MTRLTAILTCLALTGCSATSAQDTKSVELGARFTLAPGQTAAVQATAMQVRFVAVTEDSRCPRDVTCIWAGEVKVALEIQPSKAASPVELAEGISMVAGGYRVTLVRVEPYPLSPARIAPQDYRATLQIVEVGLE